MAVVLPIKASNPDSLIKALNNAKADTVRFNICMALNDEYFFKDFDKCLIYLKIAAVSTEKVKNNDWLAYTYSEMGIINSYRGQPDSALLLLDKAIAIVTKSKDEASLAQYLNNKAYVLTNIGKVTEGINSYLQSLKIKEKLGNHKTLATAYLNIGYIYQTHISIEKGLVYYRKSLESAKKVNDDQGLTNAYNNIAFCYKKIGKRDSAKMFYQEAIKHALASKNISMQGKIYNNLADEELYSTKNYSKAVEYILKALEAHQKVGDKESLSITYAKLTTAYIKQKKLTEAEENAKLSLKNALESKYPEAEEGAYLAMYHVYNAKKDYKTAINYFIEYSNHKDSVLNENKVKAIAEMEAKYQNEKKQLQIQNLNKENEVSHLKIEQQNLLNKKRKQQMIGLGVFILLLIGLIGFVYKGYVTKKKDNAIIQRQKMEVEHQKELVDEKNKEILDSITYAKRLQDAILPPQKFISKYLPNSFILYKPKDIVAGDFYWMEVIGETIFIAAADCTGHGVPGAMVSVVCSNALNRVVKEFNITEPGQILDKVTDLVIETFEKSESEVKDGMDISLCSFNPKTRELKWAGANNPIWIVKHNKPENESLLEIKANKQPIGVFAERKKFTSHALALEANDTFYLFTDGYADQFGGPDGKKFKYKPLKELLLQNKNINPAQQKEVLDLVFESWKGHHEQIDDVCFVGVRV